MSESWSSQSGDDLDDIHAWMAQRNAQLGLRTQADAFARRLWNQATQNDAGLYAGNPSDLTAIGLAALGGRGSYLSLAADNDDQAGDIGAPIPSSAATDGGSLQSHAETAGSTDQGGPYAAGNVASSQQGWPFPQAQDPGLGAPLSSDASTPSVSELDVIGRPPTQASHPSLLDSLNHNPIMRGVGGGIGYVGGLFMGIPRAGWHAIKGVGDALNFADSLLSPQGRDEALSEAKAATHNTLQYGRSVLANPSRLANDVAAQGTAAMHSLIPFTTPMADTVLGEMNHEFGIGKNAGEALTNVAGLAGGLELAEGLNAIRGFEAAQPARIAKGMAQGLDESTATYLSKPYRGQGDHVLIPRAQDHILGFKAPSWFKNVPIPDWIMDSPLNVSQPRGMSQGDFYEYHYGVDPRYFGGKLPRDLNSGKGWSGKRLGLERYRGPGRIWARTPSFWKDTAAGVAAGDALDQLPRDDPGLPQ